MNESKFNGVHEIDRESYSAPKSTNKSGTTTKSEIRKYIRRVEDCLDPIIDLETEHTEKVSELCENFLADLRKVLK